jgi:hypothetical protein
MASCAEVFNLFKEGRSWDIQCICEGTDILQAYVPLTALDTTEIGAVQPAYRS